MSIEFDKALETGNDLIDTQHRELIARVNKLTADGVVGKEKNVAVQTLDFLMDYTDFHFNAEENLQEEHAYPLLDAHKKQHAVFVKAVDDLREMLEEEEGPTEAFVEAVRKNVVDWLLRHIQIWDKQVAEYIKEA
ncbi:bacteriohemerythrin [Novisyntrophococcus fermenticellae]|uniref:bacteriohemerythrin n=1 Tax=Novisyntrophococcus fermenticellae TaxID=2068655 RepID=UPI001E2D2E83|nr:bacteriohemerythrin [Novisyntrophococcus fermenticellae]